MRGLYITLLFGLSLQVLAAEDGRPIPPQAARGRELFLQSPKGTACGTCHEMAGIGTAVGPDLSKLAAAIGAARHRLGDLYECDGLCPGGPERELDLPRDSEAKAGRQDRALGPEPYAADAAEAERETNRWDESEYEMEAPAGVGWVYLAGTGRPDWIPQMGRDGDAKRSCPRRS